MHHHNWDGSRCVSCRARGSERHCHNDIDLGCRELTSKHRQLIRIVAGVPLLQTDTLSVDVAELAQSLPESIDNPFPT